MQKTFYTIGGYKGGLKLKYGPNQAHINLPFKVELAQLSCGVRLMYESPR